MATGQAPKYRRIVLKLSGEALAGKPGQSIDPNGVANIVKEIANLVDAGVQIGLVIGGGNLVRGADLATLGLSRVTADQMGMLATVLNALALRDALQGHGVACRVMSAIAISGVVAVYDAQRALNHLEQGNVVICAGGIGNPYFTTDTTASLRAIEMQADVMLKATKVDGVYDADPEKVADAKRFTRLSHEQVLQDNLKVMDGTAICLCRDNQMDIHVFAMHKPGALLNVVMGGDEGTLITKGA